MLYIIIVICPEGLIMFKHRRVKYQRFYDIIEIRKEYYS